MSDLKDLILQTMVGKGAKAKGLPLVPVTKALHTPKPRPMSAADLGRDLDEETVRLNPIWRFAWDPANPGTFTDVTIASRGMGMDYGMAATAFEKIEFRGVKITREGGGEVDLYLDPAHMIGAWWTRNGKIKDSSHGLWRLDARLDASIVVVFGYALDAARPSPLTQEQCDDLGDLLIPGPDTRVAGLDLFAGVGTEAWICVGPARYIVAVELALHREHNDFVPGGFIGFARVHPHLMLWSNEDLVRAEATIVLARPPKGMAHGDAMHATHKALVVADTNVSHNPSADLGLPLPYTDLLYDYYDCEPATTFAGRKRGPNDHPLAKTGEVSLADSRFKRTRIIENAIRRNTPKITSKDPDIFKEARQGQFDNVHIAPRMKVSYALPNGETLVYDDLAMLNTCMHDCTHMHVRWSSFLTDKIVAGWKGKHPHSEPGAPCVPENQSVFASFPNQSTLVYRAVADRVIAGEVVVVFHHGLAYAIDQWPGEIAKLALGLLHHTLDELAKLSDEPGWNGIASDKWASFYFRIRYTGKHKYLQQRSEFDLETCMP